MADFHWKTRKNCVNEEKQSKYIILCFNQKWNPLNTKSVKKNIVEGRRRMLKRSWSLLQEWLGGAGKTKYSNDSKYIWVSNYCFSN